MRKILRSLPERFGMKITAIEEVHDLHEMKVDEMFGSLLTFELSFDKYEKKNKVVSFEKSVIL